MADNVSIRDAGGTSVPIASDDVGGVEFQKVKIDVGGDGASLPLSTSNPVPTSQQGIVEVTKGVGKVATATITRVGTSTVSAQLLASNTSRKGFIVVNDSSSNLYIKFGTTASQTSYTVTLAPGQTFVDSAIGYTGRVDAILDSGSGNAQVTELAA